MNKNFKTKLLMSLIVWFALLFSSCLFFLKRAADKHFEESSRILASQISSLIKSNDEEKNELQGSLKEEYISKAKALAYILEKNPGVQADYDELCKVASLLDIDEVNVFGKDGLIAYSTVKDYVGFSIYSGGQIAFFEPMMSDRSLELCQDLTPNTKDGKLIMYAAVWRADGDSIVQVGISPERLLEALERNDISKVLYRMPMDNTLYFIYDSEQDKVVSSSDGELFGLKDADLAFELNGSKKGAESSDYNNKTYKYTLTENDDYRIAVCQTEEYIYRDVRANALLLFIILALTLAGVFIMFGVLTAREKQREQVFVDELQNSADRLSSYKKALLAGALISLEVNLSKDELYDGRWVDNDGKELPLEDILGLTLPCSYDRYIRLWNETFVSKKSEADFSTDTDRQFLLGRFNSGNSEITFDYEANTLDGKHAFLRRDIFMHENSDGDVIAYTTVKNISEIGEARANEEAYISAMATEYDCVDVIRFEEQKLKDGISLHHRISPAFKEKMPEKWCNETSISKRLDYMTEAIVPEDRELFYKRTRREEIFRTFETEPVHTVDFRLNDNGDAVYYQERFIAIRDYSGKLTGMVVCIRCTDNEIKRELGYRSDIEQARALAESANNAKTTFLFNMSHDIRTPMNAIIGFTRLAKNHIDDREQVLDCLDKLELSADQLLNLINDVLEMSRIEAGKLEITELPVDVTKAFTAINPMLESLAVSKSIDYSSSVGNIENRYVWADRTHCSRMMVNLITNAIKYTPDGGEVSVHLEQTGRACSGIAEYRFTVTDTGIGMSEEFIEHMFEQFSRERTSTVSRIQGSGLGLAIVKRIVDALGGKIEVESELNKGSKFIITVPLRVQTDEEISRNQRIASSNVNNEEIVYELKDKKVLLVEDNELNREIGIDMLEEEGLIVETAEDGRLAVDAFKDKGSGYYDFIIMDIQMPIMNGYEATKAIRALEKPGEHVPIIAASANAFDEDIRKSLESGMDGHIAKPINVDQLIEKLKEHIGNK